MKYLLFAGAHYYPCGGFSDFVGEFDSLEEAKQVAEKSIPDDDGSGYWFYDWYHVVQNNVIICKMEKTAKGFVPSKLR